MLFRPTPLALPLELASLAQRTARTPRPLLRSFATASARRNEIKPAFAFHTAYSFHGKPGSPVYSPDGKQDTVPDWKDSKNRLKQGLGADHPLAIWRDAQLAKAPWGAGEDWFFVEPQANGVVCGLADGVGGWADSGVDASHFSQALMWHSRAQVLEGAAGSPVGILEQAYQGVLQEKDVLAGSSTACIVAMNSETGLMRAANLGDSTFFILRHAPPPKDVDTSIATPVTHALVHMQPSQTHFFNAPRQLAKMPPGKSKRGALMDMPADADLFEAVLEDGDIIILATDGFSDNVWPQELEQIVALIKERHAKKAEEATTGAVEDSEPEKSLVQTLADVCVNYARICSFKVDKESPFEVEARGYGHRDLKGGKVDDVCIVAVVVEKL